MTYHYFNIYFSRLLQKNKKVKRCKTIIIGKKGKLMLVGSNNLVTGKPPRGAIPTHTVQPVEQKKMQTVNFYTLCNSVAQKLGQDELSDAQVKALILECNKHVVDSAYDVFLHQGKTNVREKIQQCMPAGKTFFPICIYLKYHQDDMKHLKMYFLSHNLSALVDRLTPKLRKH